MRKISDTPKPHEIAEEKIRIFKEGQKTLKHSQKKHEERIEEFDLCLYAAICPICGKDLYLDRREIKKFRVRFTQYRHGRVRCPSGCRFIHPKVGNVSSPKSVKYMYCINYDIYKAHHDLTAHNTAYTRGAGCDE